MSTATVRPLRNLLIRASAGSGKTYQLANRYLQLLLDQAPVEQILATTFTRKAAGEILDRIVMRIAACADSEQERAGLAAAIQAAGGEPGALDRNRCLELLQQVTRGLHRLRISTLDSFFSQIARNLALDLGLPIGWTIVSELDDQRLRDQAIEIVLRESETTHTVRLMHLLAKGEARRGVSQLVRDTVGQLYDLFVETGEAAWTQTPRPPMLPQHELQQAIVQLRTVSEPPQKSLRTALARDRQAAEREDWDEFLRVGIARKLAEGGAKYQRVEIPPELVAAYQPLLVHARGFLLQRLANQTEGTFELLGSFHEVYSRLKRDRGALRFDDVTRLLAFSSRGIAKLPVRLDARINHLLLDEFQDTSLVQWQAIMPFAQRATAGEHSGRSFFCVGDAKQAIYGWRGGIAEIFGTVQQQLENVEDVTLAKSYRSAPAVIEAVNEVFTNLTRHGNLGRLADPVKRWQDRFPLHDTDKQFAGYVELRTTAAAEEEESQEELTFQTAAEIVAENHRRLPQATIGILVRENRAVGKLINYLRKRGIPASEEGGNPLTDSAAVQLLLSVLRLTDHPGDSVARFHVAKSPLAAPLGYRNFADQRATERLAMTVREQLVSGGYGPTLLALAEELYPSCSPREYTRLQQLIDLAYSWHPRATLRTMDFVRMVEQERVADPSVSSVRVMTVHQAKGLEFDVVVLPQLDKQLTGQVGECVVHRETPTSPVERVCRYANTTIQALMPDEFQQMFSETANQRIDEALCVLYVALTRAVRALHLVVAPSSPKQRRSPQSYAGLIAAALTEQSFLKPDQVLYQQGDPAWYRELVAESKQPQRRFDTPHPAPAGRGEPVPRVLLAPNAPQRSRNLQRVAPSRLHRQHGKTLADLVFADVRVGALSRGQLLHRWFAQVQWLEDGLPSETELRSLAVDYPDLHGQEERLLRSWRYLLSLPGNRALLSQQHYLAAGAAEQPRVEGEPRDHLEPICELIRSVPLDRRRLAVETERGFAVIDDGGLLEGTLDRLVLVYDAQRLVAAEVIDYKTDQELEGAVDRHREQLKAYRRAAMKITGLEKHRIATTLLMVQHGEAIPVDTVTEGDGQKVLFDL